jgi:metal-responsive CopG/Arc/MetJ family transcriptional regulator
MSRQTKIINMSLPKDLYSDLEKISTNRGVSRSQILKEALDRYIDDQKRWTQIRKWGEETATKLGIKDEDDIERIRDEYWDDKQKNLKE